MPQIDFDEEIQRTVREVVLSPILDSLRDINDCHLLGNPAEAHERLRHLIKFVHGIINE